MENRISSIVKKELDNPEIDFLFFYRKPENDILDSLKVANPYIDGDLVAILMPDIFSYSYETNLLPELINKVLENPVKKFGIIGIALSDSDQKSTHSRYDISKSGKLKRIVLNKKNPSGIRSAGRYILPGYLLSRALDNIPYYDNRERKIEDIFNLLIKWKVLAFARFFGRVSNVNTPQDLLNANLIALKTKGLVNYFGTSYIENSSIKDSIISSESSIIDCELENCLVLPETEINELVVKDSILYQKSIIPLYNNNINYKD
jgi:UTP-glucose-1-phosphate uridylyltransferase